MFIGAVLLPKASVISSAARSSIGIWLPVGVCRSIVDVGASM